MKKLLLIFFALISLNAFSQIQVKEGSFKKIDGYVMMDKSEHTDINNKPMALIKITAEGMKAEERARLVYKGNMATYFDVHQKGYETYLYLTAQAATFLKIIHPDYGKTECWFPEDLCDFCGYEMVVQFEGNPNEQNYLIIKTDQVYANIYIDNEYAGKQFAHKQLKVGSSHTWKIECDLFRTESGDVTITNDENVIDIKMIPEFGYLNVATIPENSANVYLNNELVGKTPYKSDKLSVGSYTVKVEKDQFKTTEETIVVKGKETTNVNIKMLSIYTDVIIKTDGESDIFIDGKQKGKGLWSGKLMEGTYIFESRKENHRTTQKTVVVTGNNQTIILDSPESINGSLDVSTIPADANIYIDGKKYGNTPYKTSTLIGDHKLKLTKHGYTDLKKKITIKEGEMLIINEKLSKSNMGFSRIFRKIGNFCDDLAYVFEPEDETLGVGYKYSKYFPVTLSLNMTRSFVSLFMELGINTDNSIISDYNPRFYMMFSPGLYFRFLSINCGIGILPNDYVMTIDVLDGNVVNTEITKTNYYIIKPSITGYIPISDEDFYITVDVGYNYFPNIKDLNGLSLGLGFQWVIW